MIVVDTNILIGVLTKHAQSIALLQDCEKQGGVGISIVTYLELLSGVQSREVKDLQKSLQDFMVLPFADQEIAELAASYRRSLKWATPDAIIAATCECGSHELYTYDRGFSELRKRWVHVIPYES